jgi:iron-sulfur cluster assembly protein/iron-sulfur cluster insertion protein
MTVTENQVNIGKKPPVILLTPEAQTKVTELLADEENAEELVLRVAVKPGGCSGFSYDMYFDTETATDDIILEYGTVKIAVDKESSDMLKGSTLEYEDGLQGAGFHIVNPNATRTCGCGSSFS